jgi:hypothetical protein
MVTKTKKNKRKVVKSAVKRGAKSTARTVKRPLKKTAGKSARKRVEKPAVKAKLKAVAKPVASALLETWSEFRPIQEFAKKPAVRSVAVKPKIRTTIRQTQSAIASIEARRTPRVSQFTYMKPPGVEHVYEVGDTVEVFCDNEKNNDRIRGWVKGIVVQVDNKLVAVQFRSNVYLTDGWMVPDHILWYPITSDQIRVETFNKKGSAKKEIPDY